VSTERSSLGGLVAAKEIIVLCGSGGVGKTSVAAATALGAASRTGGKVLVLTIDPAKRLAAALGLAEIGATRDRYSRQADLEAADLGRKSAADAATAEYRGGLLDVQNRNADSMDAYRGGMLDLREQEGSDRAARYADRGRYERGVLAVREQEAAADVARAQTAQEAAALRAAAENVRSVQSAQSLLLRARDLATRPDSMGKVDPARAAAFVTIIKDLERFLRDPAGKNLPEDVSAAARKARAAVAARSGLGPVDEGDEVDPLLDLGLGDFASDEADTPPRLGR